MRKVALLALAIVVLALVFATNRSRELPPSGPSASISPDDAHTRSVDPAPSPGAPTQHSQRFTTAVLAPYICYIAKEQCLYDPLSAASEQEAAWLIANGYPSNSELSSMSAMSVDQLTAKAVMGDTKAEVFLGKALIANGKAAEGLGRIANALVKGNVYASYAYAEAHAAEGQLHNPVLSAAYYRLAYMQGDWKATSMGAERNAEFNGAEAARADRRAMTLYRNLLDEKGRSGNALTISPRPD